MKPKLLTTASALTAALALPAGAQARTIEFAQASLPADGLIVLPVGKGGVLADLSKAADEAANGVLAKAIGLAGFKGDKATTLTLYGVGPYAAVVLIGTGDGLKSSVDLRDYGGLAARATAAWKKPVKVVVPDAKAVAHDAAETALGARLGGYDFGKWKAGESAAKSADVPNGITFLSPKPAEAQAVFVRDGEAIAEGVHFTRDLTSTPSNIKTPAWIAAQVQKTFVGLSDVTVTVFDEKQIERLGMGALYGTGQGSSSPPRLVAISYKGGKPGDAPIAFVGKGITFDTGGISIKPAENMWRMRMDMAGAAAAAGAVLTLARRKANVNAVAVMPLAENMPDGNAIRPGDVLTSMSGKTIEVLNTDAEGRLVLADGLWWVQETYQPKLAVTIATLTGAVVRALGKEHAGLFTTENMLAETFLKAGDASGEALWRLPVTQAAIASIKSDVADVKNIAAEGAAPGATVGAAFIMEWARPTTPFVHLDIAGVAWEDAGRPTEPKGAVGFGVRLLDEVARGYESD